MDGPDGPTPSSPSPLTPLHDAIARHSPMHTTHTCTQTPAATRIQCWGHGRKCTPVKHPSTANRHLPAPPNLGRHRLNKYSLLCCIRWQTEIAPNLLAYLDCLLLISTTRPRMPGSPPFVTMRQLGFWAVAACEARQLNLHPSSIGPAIRTKPVGYVGSNAPPGSSYIVRCGRR